VTGAAGKSNGRKALVNAPVGRPIGRPAATDSAETRAQILIAARVYFGKYGYDQSTSKEIARGAGLTVGAIYHYFPSKQDVFLAVYREVQASVLAQYEHAVEGEGSLTTKLAAILDVSADLHSKDRSLAAFTAIAPIEIQRHDELHSELRVEARAIYRFFERLVKASPEDLAPGVQIDEVVDFLVAMVTGLSQFGATAKSEAHRKAVDSFKRLLTGGLFATRDASHQTTTVGRRP
jgi:AcrR family transcriptional regulator